MASERECILIVEDEFLNRQILCNILSSDYDVLEAGNGKDALELLDRKASGVSAVLLDIVMPVMDGFQFLRELKTKDYSDLPVIVMTGELGAILEERALNAGACDFVAKPYRPSILLSRLRNAIAGSRVKYMAQLRHMAEHDALTDLLNKTQFQEETAEMLRSHPDRQFVLARVDIDRFQILNSLWGDQESNRFLIYVADLLRQIAQEYELSRICRVESAVFCICAEYEEKRFAASLEFLIRRLAEYNSNFLIEPSVGVYQIENPQLPVEKMFLYASIAEGQCRDKYMDDIRFYKPSMSESLIREQGIIDEMETALQQKQFEVYLQPKYNLQTNRPYGAEALVRWRHPTKGMISPGAFVPVFEKNGFIGKLDLYVWESVCRILRGWLDRGVRPSPISVNMSRADLYNPTLTDTLSGLIRKYSLTPDLLDLELTESTFMDNPELMTEKIQKLRKLGFSIMLDDFGSAYSSLNMLKDIQVDYIKIDMKFLQDNSHDTRSERVLSSVVRMAGWLGLPVIMEGVETRDQYDFLQSIGCGYIQGYFFAKPMPVGDYEHLIEDQPTTPFVSRADIRPAVVNAIWSSHSDLSCLLDDFPQPLAIYEMENEDFVLLRTNMPFNRAFRLGADGEGSGFPRDQLSAANRAAVVKAFRDAVGGGKIEHCDYTRTLPEGGSIAYRIYVKYLGKTETSYILIATFAEQDPPARGASFRKRGQ